MNEKHGHIEERIAEAAREMYHAPPDTPGEEMWREIESRLDERSHGGRRWWLAIAAALVIGLGIGRLSMVVAPVGPDAEVVVETAEDLPPASARPVNPLPYQLATRDHLSRSESLLSMVRADLSSGSSAASTGASAKRLLTRTRLLLNTPAVNDPGVRALLEDLELMLMQIVVTSETDDPREAGIVGESLEGSDLLLRLRAAATRNIGPARGL